ncbi:hypothetical protein OG898_13540 [Streptomyces sp. NBC_00193]|uniref:hypothetical protein n=1 Tax=Streptomyces sp. NBC_00193 TaxID=2975675 RepID=UPI0022512CE1|nr:hypothetical protein [Streptomyces sp. NBC_00193]MCX5297490.1 hypothetical protein [Streptomyces sp. NBC_00193]
MTEQNTTEAAPTPPEDAVPAQAGVPAAELQPVADSLVAAPLSAPEVPAAPKDRRKLFAALRWTAAVLVFAAVGSGVAYGITQPERTDIPGLSTKSDGRWVYPELSKPQLPAGAALPFAKDNPDGIHYAGLTQLLLPPPAGSTPDSTLKLEKDEAVTVDTFLSEYQDILREKMKTDLANEGLRQIVARGWTTPDGTRTRIYLLRFHSSGFADAFTGCKVSMGLRDALVLQADSVWAEVKASQRTDLGNRTSGYATQGNTSDLSLYQEAEPTGDERYKVGCIQSGDIQAVVLQSRKGEVAAVPFHQTAVLQHQLLR